MSFVVYITFSANDLETLVQMSSDYYFIHTVGFCDSFGIPIDLLI